MQGGVSAEKLEALIVFQSSLLGKWEADEAMNSYLYMAFLVVQRGSEQDMIASVLLV
jgi:hypothetical protein